MHKIYISQKYINEKNMHKINSAKLLESINNSSIISRFSHRDLPFFSLILRETLAKYSLIQLPFSLGLKF